MYDGNMLIGQGRTIRVNIGIDMPAKFAVNGTAMDIESGNVKGISDMNR